MKRKILCCVVFAGFSAARMCAVSAEERKTEETFAKPYMKNVPRITGDAHQSEFGWDAVDYKFANRGLPLGSLSNGGSGEAFGLWIDENGHLCANYRPCRSTKYRVLGMPVWTSSGAVLVLRTKQPVDASILKDAKFYSERLHYGHGIKQSPRTIPAQYELSAAVMQALDAGNLELISSETEWEPVTQTAAREGQQGTSQIS